jgi:hypothetical protein
MKRDNDPDPARASGSPSRALHRNDDRTEAASITAEELPEDLPARMAAKLEELRDANDSQASLFAEREAILAAREAQHVARLDERARVIAGLTAHLNTLTALREDDRQALQRTQSALSETRLRLGRARRVAAALILRSASRTRPAARTIQESFASAWTRHVAAPSPLRPAALPLLKARPARPKPLTDR